MFFKVAEHHTARGDGAVRGRVFHGYGAAHGHHGQAYRAALRLLGHLGAVDEYFGLIAGAAGHRDIRHGQRAAEFRGLLHAEQREHRLLARDGRAHTAGGRHRAGILPGEQALVQHASLHHPASAGHAVQAE